MVIPWSVSRSVSALGVCAISRRAPVGLFLLVNVGVLFGQFKSNTRLVVLHVSVVRSNGDLLGDLTRNQFTVYENGTAQQIRVFRREDVPVSIGMVVDNSASMKPDRHAVEAAGLSMVEASNPSDETCIVNFNDESFIDVPFTGNIQKMKDGIARVDARGGTAAFDAVERTLRYLADSASKDKRVILLITDGNDNGSKTTVEKVTEMARQRGVIVYAIGLLRAESRADSSQARKALNALTSSTGGAAFYPKNVQEVNRIIVEIAREIRSQYTIAYAPSLAALDGTFRKIQVKVNAPGKPKVRTRTGYQAVAEEKEHVASSNSSR
jgi:Ca-activated chloride channel homolog